VNQTHYTKLKSGDWGLWVPGNDAQPGDTVKVATKAGQIRTETIDQVVFRGNKDGQQYCLCSKRAKEGGSAEPSGPPASNQSRIRPAQSASSTATSNAAGQFFCPCCGEKLEVRKP
jgi:hypothetical protein